MKIQGENEQMLEVNASRRPARLTAIELTAAEPRSAAGSPSKLLDRPLRDGTRVLVFAFFFMGKNKLMGNHLSKLYTAKVSIDS